MFRKALCMLLAAVLVFGFCSPVLAATPPYTARLSADRIESGEKVKLYITTPKTASKIKIYLDGKYSKSAVCKSTEDGEKTWEASLTLNKYGSRKITLKAYSSSSKLLKEFPKSALTVSVKHAPPVTKKPIVLDYDRAVLLGKPPESYGVKQSEYGFYFGTGKSALKKQKSSTLVRGYINKLMTGLLPNKTYYYQAYVVTAKGTYKGELISFTTPDKKTWSAKEVMLEDIADRYKLLFGKTTRFYTKNKPPLGYANKTEASKHMVKITVPVWKLVSGKKVASNMSLTIHHKLKNSVKAIFEDIYALKIKFPIKKLSGFRYRTVKGPDLYNSTLLSHHSFGAAIDINSSSNLFYRNKDKRSIKDPYRIPKEVVKIFEKHGWYWGGNFKEGLDTMHFQYLGLDLTK